MELLLCFCQVSLLEFWNCSLQKHLREVSGCSGVDLQVLKLTLRILLEGNEGAVSEET